MKKTFNFERRLVLVHLVVLSMSLATLPTVNAQPAQSTQQDPALAGNLTDPNILAVGEQPEDRTAGMQFRRRRADGNLEACTVVRRDTNRRTVRGALAAESGILVDDCRPVVGSRIIPQQCDPVIDGGLGVPSHICRPSTTPVLNPNAPFEACRHVELAQDDSRLADQIRLRQQISQGCSLIGNPLPQATYLSQVLSSISLFGRSTRTGLDASARTDNVNSVLEFAIQAGDRTMRLLDSALENYEQTHRCMQRYQQARWKVQGDNHLDSEAAVDAPAHRAALERETGAECFQVVQNTIRNYQERLPVLRSHMLLATNQSAVASAGDWPIASNPNLVLNQNWRRPAGTLTPENPLIRRVDQGDFTYSPATAEELRTAAETFNGWAREIEAEWDRTHPQNQFSLARGANDIVQRNKYRVNTQIVRDPQTGRNISGDQMQAQWETFYRARISERRRQALQGVQREFVANPVFQNLANNTPLTGAWVEAYSQLIMRDRQAQDRINRNVVAGRQELERYNAAVRAHAEGRGPAPSQPSLGSVREIATAKGAIEAMVQDDPRLCSAAISYWNAASRMDTADTVLETSALVGATIVSGGIGGAAFGAASMTARALPWAIGFGGGIGVGLRQNHEAGTRSELGYNLLSACARLGGEENCRSPGNIERYLEDRFATQISRYTILLPTPGDFTWVNAVAAGMISARGGASAARFIGRGGRVLPEVVHANAENVARMVTPEQAAALTAQRTRIFGTANPNPEQVSWFENVFHALTERPGSLLNVDPASANFLTTLEQRVVPWMQRRLANTGSTFARPQDLADVLRTLHADPDLARAMTSPDDLERVLEAAYQGLAAGNTPSNVADVIKRFVGWNLEAGNSSHLQGLASTWEQMATNRMLQARAEQNFDRLPLYQQRRLVEVTRGDAARTQQELENALAQQLRRRYQDEGLSEAQIAERLRAERPQLAACATGGPAPVRR